MTTEAVSYPARSPDGTVYLVPCRCPADVVDFHADMIDDEDAPRFMLACGRSAANGTWHGAMYFPRDGWGMDYHACLQHAYTTRADLARDLAIAAGLLVAIAKANPVSHVLMIAQSLALSLSEAPSVADVANIKPISLFVG